MTVSGLSNNQMRITRCNMSDRTKRSGKFKRSSINCVRKVFLSTDNHAMEYRVIVSFLVALVVSFANAYPAFAASVVTDAKADVVIQDMANAFKRNDTKRLTGLLPPAKGHT